MRVKTFEADAQPSKTMDQTKKATIQAKKKKIDKRIISQFGKVTQDVLIIWRATINGEF